MQYMIVRTIRAGFLLRLVLLQTLLSVARITGNPSESRRASVSSGRITAYTRFDRFGASLDAFIILANEVVVARTQDDEDLGWDDLRKGRTHTIRSLRRYRGSSLRAQRDLQICFRRNSWR